MKKKFDLFFVVTFAWITFPLVAAWIMLTHPGKCALIWKREIEGTWFEKKEN